jgi:hypothetical protein
MLWAADAAGAWHYAHLAWALHQQQYALGS